MDTHIIDASRGEEAIGLSRAQVILPGEDAAPAGRPDDPASAEPIAPLPPDPPMAADTGARLGAAPPVRRRRRWLLGTVAVLALGAAGAGFLLSPYNTVYPIDTARLQSQGRKLAASVRQQAEDLVAPAAKVARVSGPQQRPPPQRDTVIAPSSDDQMRELLALRQGAATSPVLNPAPAPASNPAPAPMAARSAGRGQPLAASAPIMAAPSVAVAPPLPAGVAPPAHFALAAPPVLETGAAPVPAPANPPAATLSPPVSTVASPVQAAPASLPLASSPEATVVVAAISPPRLGSGISDFEPAVPVDGDVVPVAPRDPPPQNAARRDTAARETIPLRRVAAPADPVTLAAEIRAAPMALPQQVEVLNVVARLAIIIRDMRTENEALKARVESTADRFDAAVAGFDRRLALAEARGAVNAAMGGDAQGSNGASRWNGVGGGDAQGSSGDRRWNGAGGVEAPAGVVANRSAIVGADVQAANVGGDAQGPNGAIRWNGVGGGGRSRPAPPPAGVQIVPAAATGAAAPAGAARYRVTAASPGLAMLALLDRSGGEGSQLQVAVGDQVPGYGRVTAIQQRGSSWIVQTDKGPDKGVIQ